MSIAMREQDGFFFVALSEADNDASDPNSAAAYIHGLNRGGEYAGGLPAAVVGSTVAGVWGGDTNAEVFERWEHNSLDDTYVPGIAVTSRAAIHIRETWPDSLI